MSDRESLKRIAGGTARWQAQLPTDVPGRETDARIPVAPLYTPADTAGIDYETALGWPGEYPFTRGPYPTMYRGRLWTMRQYAGYGTAEEANRRFRYLLEQGNGGLSVAFDLPTQMGYDSDHPLSRGEVGRVGVAIDTLADMEILFDGIPLDKVSTSMTINAPAAVLLAMYIAVARRQGVNPASLSGTVQNDILKEYLARGTYIFPPRPSLRLVVDVFAYCHRHVPRWNVISISGYHIREAGSDAVQEVAFTLANGIAYVTEAVRRGLDVDAFGPRLSFFFNAHMNLFEEAAKFRAARRLWAEIMRERFKARDPRSWALRFHTQTAGSALTAQQPELNAVRVAYQALAAVLGGTQSLHTNAWDEALALPSEQSSRIALRTQQILAHETGVADVIDPLGGSYFVESLTESIYRRAREYIRRIDAMGGAVRAIELRFMQREIEESAYRQQQQVESGQRVVVGVNRYQEPGGQQPRILRVDDALERRQVERLSRIRRHRDGEQVRSALERLREAAEGDDNLMPYLIDAVERYASIGEICGVLREVFGEYREGDHP
ncbi:MAG: methylmalonyl-CoA mutase family protein [Firmicutes bacterium]|nr:methylmalonyl-CoA mutase family protein [Bacillota bacterium]